MPEVTSCPDCEKKLKVPDDLIGKKVRCPGCSTMFVAKADRAEEDEAPRPKAKVAAPRTDGISSRRSDAPARREREEEQDDRPRGRSREDYDDRDRDRDRDRHRDQYDDRPSRRSRRDDDRYEDDYDRRPSRSALAGGWRGTRIGLLLVIIANYMYLTILALVILGTGIAILAGATLLSGALGGQFNEDNAGQVVGGAIGMGLAAILFIGFLYFLWFAAQIVNVVGSGLCMMVPAHRSGVMRGMAIAAFSCLAIAFFLLVVSYLLRFMLPGVMRVGSILSLVSGIFYLGGFICFTLFLCFVAWEMKEKAVATRLITYMVAYLIFWFVIVPLLGFLVICGTGLSLAGARNANAAASAGTAAMVVSTLVGGIVVLGVLALQIWWIYLLQQVKGLIDYKIARL